MKQKLTILLLVAVVAFGTLFVANHLDRIAGDDKVFTETDGDGFALAKEKQKTKKKAKPQQILEFVDAHGETYQTKILEDVPKTPYRKAGFVYKDGRLTYEDEIFRSRLGVDVSHHQGDIDWQKVRADGYEFAFIRIGYRGYGKDGTINLDRKFDSNIQNAHAAGLDVGVYFFSQAINETEAKEEASFVLEHLAGYTLELPVVYDPENILDDVARTDTVSGEQFTANTQVFLSAIEEAGYQPMVYSNMVWEAFTYDMRKISRYPVWYADYEKKPQTPYAFTFWQFSEKGHVNGIGTTADLNIELVKKQKQKIKKKRK